MKKYRRLDQEAPLIKYRGVFHKQLNTFEAIALIGTIGAGVLGIPFAVAKVGMGLGIIYIFVIGLLMMGFNLLIGEVATRTSASMQLAGLCHKYLGRTAGVFMTLLLYLMMVGALLVYIIGEGEALAALFGGQSFIWSLAFFAVATIFIFLGMRTIKKVELILSLIILSVVILIAGVSAPHISLPNYLSFDLTHLLFPYGVLMFAFHTANTIPEAHSILKNRDKNFKIAIFISSLIVIFVYALFALSVVGVTGSQTTEIATIGLGEVVGRFGMILGNTFAALAMGTSFLIIGLSLRDSLIWDYKIQPTVATPLVCFVPLGLFLLGLRSFITVIDIIGGVFISLEMLLVILIYWQAKRKGDLPGSKFKVYHAFWLTVVLSVMLVVGAVYSIIGLF